VHYYEDGNVRMSTSKSVEVSGASGAEAVVREITKAENKFQEELNRAFVQLAEGSFKGLRRQLPVTRQRVEWEKIGGYRVSLSGCECGEMVLTVCVAWPGYWRWTFEVG
jgi:capping protein alpha